eukprot:GHRQ01007775.1.p3 GENE.GHRQ01007775.1~~GHRQ01007775.1.p3  ORF type:complete len:120 (+),score=9.76 GHRQ01007775.1:258-617(+)
MGFMDRMKALGQKITGQEPEPETLPQQLLRQVDEATTLTWRQRAIGFGITFGIGLLFSFLSLMFLWTLQLTKFAVLYSIGSVLSIGRYGGLAYVRCRLCGSNSWSLHISRQLQHSLWAL